MKKVAKTFCWIVSFFTAFTAGASEAQSGCITVDGQSSCTGLVSAIYLREDGHIAIRTANLLTDIENITECTVCAESPYIILRSNSKSFKEKYSALLSAAMADKIVTIALMPSSSGSCEVQYILLDTER